MGGDPRQGLNVTGASPKMNADNPRRAGCDQSLDLGRVKVMRSWIYVGENGCYVLPLQDMSGCHKRERWDDYFAAQFECASGDLQCDRGVTHRNAMLHAKQVGDTPFKLLN